jgi:hypothetical protein
VQDYSPETSTLRVKVGLSPAEIQIPYISGRSLQVLKERYVLVSYPLGTNDDLLSITSKLDQNEAPYAMAILDFARVDVRGTGLVPMMRIAADGQKLVETQIHINMVGQLLAEEGLLTLEQSNNSKRVLSSGYNHLQEFAGTRSLFQHQNGDIIAGLGWSCAQGFKVERDSRGALTVTLAVSDPYGELAAERHILLPNADNRTFSLYMKQARRPL